MITKFLLHSLQRLFSYILTIISHDDIDFVHPFEVVYLATTIPSSVHETKENYVRHIIDYLYNNSIITNINWPHILGPLVRSFRKFIQFFYLTTSSLPHSGRSWEVTCMLYIMIHQNTGKNNNAYACFLLRNVFEFLQLCAWSTHENLGIIDRMLSWVHTSVLVKTLKSRKTSFCIFTHAR